MAPGSAARSLRAGAAAPCHQDGGEVEVFAEGDIDLRVTDIGDGAGVQLPDEGEGEGGVGAQGKPSRWPQMVSSIPGKVLSFRHPPAAAVYC